MFVASGALRWNPSRTILSRKIGSGCSAISPKITYIFPIPSLITDFMSIILKLMIVISLAISQLHIALQMGGAGSVRPRTSDFEPTLCNLELSWSN